MSDTINGITIVIASKDQGQITKAAEQLSRVLVGLSLDGIQAQMTFSQVEDED